MVLFFFVAFVDITLGIFRCITSSHFCFFLRRTSYQQQRTAIYLQLVCVEALSSCVCWLHSRKQIFVIRSNSFETMTGADVGQAGSRRDSIQAVQETVDSSSRRLLSHWCTRSLLLTPVRQNIIVGSSFKTTGRSSKE